jgi:hypothetical protein
MYRGIKVVRSGVSNTTLVCSPSYHGRPRYDTVQLNGDADEDYCDLSTFEYGLVHAFYSYSGDSLLSLLQWGATKFNVGEPEERLQQSFYTPYTQFVLLQRYRPTTPQVRAMLPLQHYRLMVLSDDFETELVGVIRCRARPLAWFHGDGADDMKKRKGAVFCQFT